MWLSAIAIGIGVFMLLMLILTWFIWCAVTDILRELLYLSKLWSEK